MRKLNDEPRKVPPRKRRPAQRATHRVKRSAWHWFDHPAMQARIEAAEAELREGRYEHFGSREEFFKHLDGLR